MDADAAPRLRKPPVLAQVPCSGMRIPGQSRTEPEDAAWYLRKKFGYRTVSDPNLTPSRTEEALRFGPKARQFSAAR